MLGQTIIDDLLSAYTVRQLQEMIDLNELNALGREYFTAAIRQTEGTDND